MPLGTVVNVLWAYMWMEHSALLKTGFGVSGRWSNGQPVSWKEVSYVDSQKGYHIACSSRFFIPSRGECEVLVDLFRRRLSSLWGWPYVSLDFLPQILMLMRPISGCKWSLGVSLNHSRAGKLLDSILVGCWWQRVWLSWNWSELLEWLHCRESFLIVSSWK